jgi:hypothetical protein
VINITSWAYFPSPIRYSDNASMLDIFKKNEFTLRLILWKNFPEHERSIKKDYSEMVIDNVPIYHPTSKKYKTFLGLGYFRNPITKTEIEIFNEPYTLDELKDNYHVIAEPSKTQIQKNKIFGFFSASSHEYNTNSLRLYNADKKFIKSLYDHFNLQEGKSINPVDNLGVSGIDVGLQKIDHNLFLIYALEYFIFKGDKFNDVILPFNKDYKADKYKNNFLDHRYKIKKIKK